MRGINSTKMKQTYNSLIDEYLVLTMARSIRRHWLMLGNLTSMRVPYKRIKFVVGMDATGYSNMQAVADAAEADGYPFLHQFAVGLKSAYVQQSAGNVALFWSWAKTLQYIQRSGKTCVLSWDDRFLMLPFDRLEAVIKELVARDEEFYALQLRLRAPDDHIKALRYTAKNPRAVRSHVAESDNFYATVYGRVPSYYALLLDDGFLGYDETMVLSPKGAAWLLQKMLSMEDATESFADFTFQETLDVPLTAKNTDALQRSRLNNDNWLCWGLKKEIAVALEDGKGLYHPRHPSYTFIDEPLSHGSDVEWNVQPDDVEFPQKIQFMEL